MTTMQNLIQLANINEELKRLWDEEQGKDKIRACLFNLIIYSQKAERASFCKEMIHSVISKFPCRVIVITTDDQTKEDYLRTGVTTETVTVGVSQIFCEIIQVEVAGKLIERVPFIVLPHILPDLPVYLLWTQDPSTENAVLPHLLPFAKRIIFDSEATVDLQKFSQSVLSLVDHFECELGDLNWSALNGWRRIITTVFDTPEMLIRLVQSHIVRIGYFRNPTQFHPHNEIEAAYLQAWLAAQLGWSFQSIENNEGNVRLSYKRLSQDVAIFLTPVEDKGFSLSPGALISLEIESYRSKAHIVFKRHPDTRQVFIQYSDEECCELPLFLLLGGTQHGQEIIEEIFYTHPGQHYKNMLQVLSQIPWRKNS